MSNQTPTLRTSLRKGRVLGLVLALLLACTALFSFGGQAHAQSPNVVPCCSGGGLTYTRSNATTYANNHWNWRAYNDSNTVAAGNAQPDFECAEFVSRSLTHGGIVPGLSAYNSSQTAYGNYKPGNGKTYDMLLVTPLSGYHTFQAYLTDYGLATNIGHNLSSARYGDVVIFEDSNHVAQHTVIIVKVGSGTGTTLIDAHNNAHYQLPLIDEIDGFSYWYILHITV